MNILHINACVRNGSRTNKLAQHALSKLEGNIEELNLDFEKMNETLSNPEFANWYYNKMMDKTYTDMTMQDFVKIVNDYTENQMH